jgi:hypothetical protein
LGDYRRTRFPVNQHPIIASVESQRNAGSFAPFGIKNARRSAREHESVISCRIDELLAHGATAGLLHYDVPLTDDSIELSRTGK